MIKSFITYYFKSHFYILIWIGYFGEYFHFDQWRSQFIFPILQPFKFLLRNHWRSIDRVDKIEQPKLFIRGMGDEIVPTSQMK